MNSRLVRMSAGGGHKRVCRRYGRNDQGFSEFVLSFPKDNDPIGPARLWFRSAELLKMATLSNSAGVFDRNALFFDLPSRKFSSVMSNSALKSPGTGPSRNIGRRRERFGLPGAGAGFGRVWQCFWRFHPREPCQLGHF